MQSAQPELTVQRPMLTGFRRGPVRTLWSASEVGGL